MSESANSNSSRFAVVLKLLTFGVVNEGSGTVIDLGKIDFPAKDVICHFPCIPVLCFHPSGVSTSVVLSTGRTSCVDLSS